MSASLKRPERTDRSEAARFRRRLIDGGYSLISVAAEAGMSTPSRYQYARVVTAGKKGAPTLAKLVAALDRLEARKAGAEVGMEAVTNGQ